MGGRYLFKCYTTLEGCKGYYHGNRGQNYHLCPNCHHCCICCLKVMQILQLGWGFTQFEGAWCINHNTRFRWNNKIFLLKSEYRVLNWIKYCNHSYFHQFLISYESICQMFLEKNCNNDLFYLGPKFKHNYKKFKHKFTIIILNKIKGNHIAIFWNYFNKFFLLFFFLHYVDKYKVSNVIITFNFLDKSWYLYKHI